jgi:hypothetical protein
MSNENIDRQAISELQAMARVYRQRGNLEQAEKLMQLVDQMRNRLSRTKADSSSTDHGQQSA